MASSPRQTLDDHQRGALLRERDVNHTYVKWEHSKRAWDTAGLESGPRTQAESLRALKQLTAGLETTTACEAQISSKSLGGQQCGQLTPKRVHGKDTGKALHFNVNEGVSSQCNAKYKVLMAHICAMTSHEVTIELVLLIGHLRVNLQNYN